MPKRKWEIRLSFLEKLAGVPITDPEFEEKLLGQKRVKVVPTEPGRRTRLYMSYNKRLIGQRFNYWVKEGAPEGVARQLALMALSVSPVSRKKQVAQRAEEGKMTPDLVGALLEDLEVQRASARSRVGADPADIEAEMERAYLRRGGIRQIVEELSPQERRKR